MAERNSLHRTLVAQQTHNEQTNRKQGRIEFVVASLCNLYTTNIRFSLHNSAEFCRSEQHYHPPILTSKAPKSSTQLHHHSTPKIPRGLNAPITPRLMIYTNQSVLNTHNLSTLINKPKSTLKNSFIKMCLS